MREDQISLFRCPACGGELAAWDVRERAGEEIAEGALACSACAATYQVHARLPILLPSGRRAVDDLSVLLASEATRSGFAESVRRIAAGTVEYPILEPFGKPVDLSEVREAAYRETEAFWDTFSRNRLVQQQLNAIDQHWDALEEVWVTAEVNFADRVLDVGTGWGGALHYLLEHGPQDALVIGLDTAFLNLKIAQGRAQRAELEQAVFAAGDIAVPPFPTGAVDSVVSWFGVGATPRLRESLEGVVELLAPGHAFAAGWTPLVDDMEGLAGRDDLLLLAERLDIPVSPDQAAAAAEAAGCDEVDVRSIGPIFVLSGRAPRRDESEGAREDR